MNPKAPDCICMLGTRVGTIKEEKLVIDTLRLWYRQKYLEKHKCSISFTRFMKSQTKAGKFADKV